MDSTGYIRREHKDDTSLSDLLNEANTNPEDVFVVKSGSSEVAAIMSWERYRSMQETLEVMTDPELMNAIKEGMSQLAQGKTSNWSDVKKRLGIG